MGRLTETFFTAHPSCATQQKPCPSPPRKGRGFVYAHLWSLTRAKTHLGTNPLPHIVNARTTPKNATERLAMRNPPAIEQTKHPRPRMRSGARRFVAQSGSKPWIPQVSSPQTHSAPSASFPPHDLSRGHADLLCLLDRLLAACRAVDFLSLSLTSDRRVFFGRHSTYFPRARARQAICRKSLHPSPRITST